MTFALPCPHCGEPIDVEVDVTHHLQAQPLDDLVDDAWDPVSAPAPSWRERIQERGEDTP